MKNQKGAMQKSSRGHKEMGGSREKSRGWDGTQVPDLPPDRDVPIIVGRKEA
jgi:hypothetical protein